MRNLAVCLLVPLVLMGCSTTITGVVRDKPTGNPLSAASVSIGNQSAMTNATGAYELHVRVKPSTQLLVNAPGYFLYTASVAPRHDEGSALARDVELVPRSQITARQ